MILLTFYQNDRELPFLIFKDDDAAYAFCQKLPGFLDQDEEMSLDEAKLPPYMEITYENKRIPFTKFMFEPDVKIEIFFKYFPFADGEEEGLIEGVTKVDSYIVDNREVEEYITSREKRADFVCKLFEEHGFEALRSLRGSEDGEAILYKKAGDVDYHFFDHLDPNFIYDLDEEEVKKEIEEIEEA
ncbi:hypothetical protein [Guggenheimella bovis]